MFIAAMVMLAQVETTANKPAYFIPVFLGMFLLGAVAWLIAAVLGFARARLLAHRQDGFRSLRFACCCFIFKSLPLVLEW